MPFSPCLIFLSICSSITGNWRDQLKNLNLFLERTNPSRHKKKKIRPVTEKEWWVVWGVILSANPLKKGGKALFQKPEQRRLSSTVNLGTKGENFIAERRFMDIKEHLRHAFAGRDSTDPWNEIRPLIDGFNQNRRGVVAASATQVLDECMSAFQPRTTKSSLLPHLSYVARKPKPLGTEFKVSKWRRGYFQKLCYSLCDIPLTGDCRHCDWVSDLS